MLKKAFDRAYSALKSGSSYAEMGHDIDFVIACGLHKRKAIWEYFSGKLFDLAALSAKLREKILGIMKTGTAHQKFVLAAARKNYEPAGESEDYWHDEYRAFVGEIFRLAIVDGNEKVERCGASGAVVYHFYDLAQTIKEEAAKTNVAEIRCELEHCCNELTTGYTITENEAGAYVRVSGVGALIPKELCGDEIHDWVITRFKYLKIIRDLYWESN